MDNPNFKSIKVEKLVYENLCRFSAMSGIKIQILATRAIDKYLQDQEKLYV